MLGAESAGVMIYDLCVSIKESTTELRNVCGSSGKVFCGSVIISKISSSLTTLTTNLTLESTHTFLQPILFANEVSYGEYRLHS